MSTRITIDIPDGGGPMHVTLSAEFGGHAVQIVGRASYPDSIADIEADLLRKLKARVDAAIGTSDTIRKGISGS